MEKVFIAQHSKISNYYCSTDIELDEIALNKLVEVLESTSASIVLCTSSIMLHNKNLIFGLPINTINSNYSSLKNISKIKNGVNTSFLPMLAFTREKMNIEKIFINICKNDTIFDYVHVDGINRIDKTLISINTLKKLIKNVDTQACREIILEQVLACISEDNKIVKVRKHYYFYVTKKYFTVSVIKNRYINLPLKVKVKIDAKFSRIRKRKK